MGLEEQLGKDVIGCSLEVAAHPKSFQLVARAVGEEQEQLLLTHALDVVLASNGEEDDISNVNVEVDARSGQDNSNLPTATEDISHLMGVEVEVGLPQRIASYPQGGQSEGVLVLVEGLAEDLLVSIQAGGISAVPSPLEASSWKRVFC